jgi:hypothetical protein
LLSDPQVTRFLSESVVPCWEMVRPVPKVTIDFGQGRVLERTLGGNTILALLLPDGRIVDALAGVYTPKAFLAEANETLAYLAKQPNPGDADLAAWHREQVDVAVVAAQRPITLSKAVVESPLLQALGLQPEARPRPTSRESRRGPTTPAGQISGPQRAASGLDDSLHLRSPKAALAALSARIEDVSKRPASVGALRRTGVLRTDASKPSPEEIGRAAVEADSKINVTLVRPATHLLFSTWQKLPAYAIAKDAVFRQLLHVDVDDPYLGLAAALVPGTPTRPN